MGFFEFLLDLIIISMLGAAGITFLAGRAAWRGGKRLLGWMNEQKKLPGTPQDPTREAEDVVVEPIDPPVTGKSRRRSDEPVQNTQPARKREGYVRLDPDAGATSGDVIKVMRRYVTDDVVGPYAQGVIDTLESAEMRHQSIFAELDGTFQRGTISWDKFAAPTYAALDAILRNAALQANRIQTFDTASYLRLRRSMGREWRTEANTRSQTSEQRWRLYKDILSTLDEIQVTNEGLLLELDKLASELVTLQATDPTEQSDSIIEEIRRLVEEAKYYRQ